MRSLQRKRKNESEVRLHQVAVATPLRTTRSATEKKQTTSAPSEIMRRREPRPANSEQRGRKQRPRYLVPTALFLTSRRESDIGVLYYVLACGAELCPCLY